MKKLFFIFSVAALVFCAAFESAAAPRRRNYRRARRAAPAATPTAAASAPKPPPPILAAGRWSPEVLGAIDAFIREKGIGSAAYDAKSPPAAVIVLSDCGLEHDLGEAVLRKMVERADFKFDDEFWRIFPIIHGRIPVRAAYENFFPLPVSVWREQGSYRQYRKGFLKAYRDMCARQGRKECRMWLSRLLRGFTREELASLAKTLIKEEIGGAFGPELVEARPGDKDPVAIRTGLRVVPEMGDLVQKLSAHGFEVWLLGDEPREFAAAVSEEFGLPGERTMGAQVDFSSQTLKATGDVLDPFPFRGGKASTVSSALGRPPVFVIGAAAADIELLAFGAGLRVVLDRGDEALGRIARDRGWILQPAFAP